MHIFSYFIFK